MPNENTWRRLADDYFNRNANGIVITDAEGVIVEVNPAFAHWLGYGPEELAGAKPRLFRSGLHEAAFFSDLWQSLARDGAWRGEIANRDKNGDLVAALLTINAIRDGEGRHSHYVAHYTDISHLKEIQHRLEQLAYHDSLTGLPNRALLLDRMGQMLAWAGRRNRPVAVGMLDLDGFKQINDACGHHVGDEVLREVAGRLLESVRAGDTVARLGGDEFVLLLTDLDDDAALDQALRRVLTRVAEPTSVGGLSLKVSASVGIARYPDDGDDPGLLLRHADIAMYRAKRAGAGGYRVYSDGGTTA